MIYGNLNKIQRYTNDGIGEIADPTIYQQTGNRGGINTKKHKKIEEQCEQQSHTSHVLHQ
jgi:hypothetical protein